uniref:C2 domain-containing protein n=1 Tax=Denticeps clupeoides TaxID=299321 RepID=A0AAY4DVA5_9TELE
MHCYVPLTHIGKPGTHPSRTHSRHFRWPHYGKIIRDEVLSISVYNCSKMFSNRSVDWLKPVAASLANQLPIYLELDVRYHPVEGAAGNWESEDFLIMAVDLGSRITGCFFCTLLSLGQVNVNVIEAQKLVGVNINPAVYVRVGDEKRHTSTQKSTNCPFYNENFMFEFQETQDVLFDRVIEISVVHKKTLAFLMTRIGTFKIDISTVYSQPDHRFYQKWAPLTDPNDTRTGVKGYVKCTLSVVMKGDAMGMASLPNVGSQNDDIEKNLLLPKRMPVDRPWAKFLLKIYRAEGLPSMNAGFLGSFSKMMGDKKVFIDPYVQVTFAGQQGETSVESNTNAPEWNEQISFIEQFPPLARRVKVQIMDDANIGDVAVATHFLDLHQISNPNRNGFRPTFGPSWVNLYGSPQNSALRDIHRDLNEGLSEGIFYRGRVLLSLSVEVYYSPTAVVESKSMASVKSTISRLTFKRKSKKSKEKNKVEQGQRGPTEEPEESTTEVPGAVTVEVEEIHPLPEDFLGQKEEFLLFASLFEVTMIDPSIGTKPVTFELSIGTNSYCSYGIWVDKLPEQALLDSEDELERVDVIDPGCIPMFNEKPCVYVWNYFEDHSFRFHNSNWLSKMADRLEYGFDEVEKLLKRRGKSAKERLVEVFLEFVASCKQYSSNADRKRLLRPNNLDKCRLEYIKKNILLAKQALRAKRRTTRRSAKERLADARRILKRLRFLAKEPQSTLPDVFLWMMSGGRRVAYARIPSHTIIFSLVEEEKGKDCGSFSLQTPGGPVGEIFAKIEVYLWLGVTKYAKNCFSINVKSSVLPDSRYFQLRAHIYQARGIIAADDNGLSDPFTKVVFSTQCQVTRVMEETLSPTWTQLLVFDQILMEGGKEEFRDDPPLVIINIYDYNKLGSPQSLGVAFAAPELKFVEEPYKKPMLQFFDIQKGKGSAGELLAAFELIELDYASFGEPSLSADVEPREPEFLREERYYVIPEGVRPVLRKFRIEVLYWGVRDLKRVNLFEVEKPQVRIECAGQRIESEEIESSKLNPNFSEMVKHFDVELPELEYLHPPLTIFVMEQRAFGRLVLVGTHVVQSLMHFAPKDLEEWNDDEEGEPEPALYYVLYQVFPCILSQTPLKKVTKKEEELEEEEPEKEELDWWSKYYASLAELEKQVGTSDQMSPFSSSLMTHSSQCFFFLQEDKDEDMDEKMIATLKLYKSELENEFSQFMDWLHTFTIYKGKSNYDDDDDDESERTMGKYKGSFLIYPISNEDEDVELQITNGVPKNTPMKILVRVYVVKATNLAPTDPNGKADPYVVVKVGQQQQDSKERYIPKQLNPVFGEVFELTVSFPLETDLTLFVYDHDLVGSDDLIGETRIDLENRFYSHHRAGCGLALYYDKDGYNKWRDTKKPSAILAELCRKNAIPSAEYRDSEVKVLNKIFKVPPEAFPEEDDMRDLDEHKALSVLHRWGEMREFIVGACPLVPEHVEVRSLLNSDKPGLPQGYVHMWIDMFPVDVPAPPPVNIKPRLPVSYELRVIIWNTDDVVLDDVNPFTGVRSSDIYVKGWIKGLDDEKQETDVHFNSLTGEGNFNWRFVFHFDYLPTEKEIIYKRKESFFSIEESEFRQPAVLVLQVWDYDRIGANDFLGSIELRLNDMVRAAKSSEQCSVKMAKDKATPRFSVFRSKRMKGWWPLIKLKSQEDIEREEREAEEEKKKKKKKKKKGSKRSKMNPEDLQFVDSSGNTFLLMGKVEAEFQLVTAEEAEKNPVGKARKEPEPLEKPNRPKTSFNWFVNPMKTFVFFIWKKYKKYIIALIILAILALFLFLILYTLPTHISQLIVNG